MDVPKNFVPEPFGYREVVEFEVERLTNLGLGVGRVDDWVVMLPFVIPGERVRARVYRNHKNYSDADLVEVLTPSPDRVEARCPLYGDCGGCQYQHLAYRRQLAEKTAQVAEVMERIGGIRARVEPARPSPRTFGYRSKLTPHYNRPAKDGSQPIGFLRIGRRNALIDVPQCPIATPAINEALPEVRERARREGGRKRRRRGGTLLLRETLEGVVSDPQAVVSERVGSVIYQFKAGEFFQNNPFVLAEMVDHVVGEAAAEGVRHLVDAYCGVGLFALAAAARFESVTGVEISDPAVRWARVNAEVNGIGNCRFRIGQAESIFADLPVPADGTAVVIDPPRKGCDEGFRRQLLAFGPERIVYVSCDPATQARDLGAFVEGGYRVLRLQPFDLFPHTRHIENVATLSAGRRPG